MNEAINVNYKWTSNAYTALSWLRELDDITAFDFEATGLGHPSKEKLTHLAFASSEDEGRVIVFANKHIEKVVLNWLITTDITQIWHNASFDFKHIFYQTKGKLPKNYEDTAMLAKCLTNHVEVYKARVGLKELMGHHYGDWGVSTELFTEDNMTNETLIKYAATDACATYKLWENMNNYITKQKDLHGKT